MNSDITKNKDDEIVLGYSNKNCAGVFGINAEKLLTEFKDFEIGKYYGDVKSLSKRDKFILMNLLVSDENKHQVTLKEQVMSILTSREKRVLVPFTFIKGRRERFGNSNKGGGLSRSSKQGFQKHKEQISQDILDDMKVSEGYLKDEKWTPFVAAKKVFIRVVKGNVESSANELLSAEKPKTTEEMKEIAHFFFQKIIADNIFLTMYAQLFKLTRKDYRSLEDSKKNTKTTDFCMYVIKNALAMIRGDLDFFTNKAVFENEDKYEDRVSKLELAEKDRLENKARILRAMDFILLMYNYGVWKFTHLEAEINRLLDDSNPENILVLTRVLVVGSPNLINTHFEIFLKILKHIKEKAPLDIKIPSYLAVTCDKVLKDFLSSEKYLHALSNNSALCARYNADMSVFPSRKTNAVVDEIKNSVEEKRKVLTEKIKFFVENIVGSLESCHDDEDIDDAVSGIQRFTEKNSCNNQEFWYEYLLQAIIHPKVWSKMTRSVVLFFNNILSSSTLLSVLDLLHSEIPELVRSDPISKEGWPALLLYLRIDNKISLKEFDRLITEDWRKYISRFETYLKEKDSSRHKKLLNILQ